MKKKVFIFGAGGHGRVVLDILKSTKKFNVVGFIDHDKNNVGNIIDGVKVIGSEEHLDDLIKNNITHGIVAVGDNQIRCQVADYLEQKGFLLINAIHPTATINGNVSIGKNVVIAAGAVVCTHSTIENNVIINTGAIVEHENIIKNGTHIAPGAKLAGRVEIGQRVFLGIGSVVIQCLKIGDETIVGAGAVVLKDLPPRVVAVGIPAKIIKNRDS